MGRLQEKSRRSILTLRCAWRGKGKLKRLQKEGKTPMNEHITMFKTLVNQAKIGKDEEALCHLFLETLPRKLQERLLTLQFPLDGIK